MPPPIIVTTSQGNYPIYIGVGLLKKQYLAEHIHTDSVCVISHPTIAAHYEKQLQAALAVTHYDSYCIPEGESNKSVSAWMAIIDHLIQHQHGRDTTLISLGGGVISDLTGFVAATYQRGVDLCHVPTSLLGQVDAAIGGKTAINHTQGKNLVGAFYQPNCVLIDLNTLITLPQREYLSAFAEIIKVALLSDPALLMQMSQSVDSIINRDLTSIAPIIYRACEIKAQIVSQDTLEKTSTRMTLNLGHTVAHAIEHQLGYGTWLHGEAVAVGLIYAIRASMALLTLPDHVLTTVRTLLTSLALPTVCHPQINYATLCESMMLDKKVKNKQLRMVLLEDIGQPKIVTINNPQQLIDQIIC